MQFKIQDGRFPSTQWSIVLGADATTTGRAKSSLENLCLRYWYPLYVYARRNGRSHHEAEDCTQAFLLVLLSKNKISRADPEKGRFRTFLLSAFKHYLVDEWRMATRQKQGGITIFESIEWNQADQRFSHQLEDCSVTPSQAYDQAWAVEMIEQAKGELRHEYESTGRYEIFHAIEPLILEQPGNTSLAERAGQLGMTAHAFSTALSRARHRLGKLIAARILDTVQDADHAEQELRHLIDACRNLYNLL